MLASFGKVIYRLQMQAQKAVQIKLRAIDSIMMGMVMSNDAEKGEQ
jgi:hypothetical protein